MGWSAEVYKGNLQEYIDRTRAHLLDIDAVGITLPLDIISYLFLGKLMHDDKLDKIVNNCAMSEDCTSSPYLVLDALQTWLTHKGSKKESDQGTATPGNGKFLFKIVHLCANNNHNPEATTHVESRCYEKYPHLRLTHSNNNHQPKKTANASASFAHASLFVSYISGLQGEGVVIDSGASHHMLRSRNLFTSFTPEKIVIKTGNPNAPLIASGHGTAEIFTNGRVVTLVEFLLVPSITKQLLSLVQFINSSIKITKNSQYFDISDDSGSLFSGEIIDNLLHSNFSQCPKAPINFKSGNHELWHHRLGHPSDHVMKAMGLPGSSNSSMCAVCICTKMTLIPFSSHFPLQRLHMDLVGPITPPSNSGFKYFFTIVNQYSSFKFVQFLKLKSDAFEEFERFTNIVENLQGISVKDVVSDQGGEFVNNAFSEFASRKGILQTFSPAETPELNGFDKRANRTILNKARSLPKNYWAEAVNAATFISNMLASPSRPFSPYEMWTKLSPPCHRLRTFGCKAYIAVPKGHRSWKLGNTGDVGILVGFKNEGSVYCILRLWDKKLVKTRHARFDENVFPKISNDSVPFAMSKQLCEGEVAHDSDCSSVLTHEEISDQLSEDCPPSPVVPASAVVAPNQINGDISSSNILTSRRTRKPRVFLTTLGNNILNHFNQAIRGPESSGWPDAIQKELDAMARLAVWEVVDLTSSIKTVGTTWVFRKKNDGDSVTFKARLCAQGFSQVHGIDFSKTFAPTGQLNSLWALISHAASNNLQFHQLDVKTAFLNADLDEEVFLSVPQGVNLDKK
jgi:hypothetical protein